MTIPALPFADFAAEYAWNGRPFIRLGAVIERGPRDGEQILKFYRAAEQALAPLGFTRWAAIAKCSRGEPVFRALISLVGPGEWADVNKLPRSD